MNLAIHLSPFYFAILKNTGFLIWKCFKLPILNQTFFVFTNFVISRAKA
jgi:hypothetical protein